MYATFMISIVLCFRRNRKFKKNSFLLIIEFYFRIRAWSIVLKKLRIALWYFFHCNRQWHQFSAENGIRQGGVPSLWLFNWSVALECVPGRHQLIQLQPTLVGSEVSYYLRWLKYVHRQFISHLYCFIGILKYWHSFQFDQFIGWL